MEFSTSLACWSLKSVHKTGVVEECPGQFKEAMNQFQVGLGSQSMAYQSLKDLRSFLVWPHT